MKRSILSLLLLVTLVAPAFAAIDTFIYFDAPGGKQMKVQVIGLTNASVTEAEFRSGRLTAGHRKWAPFHITKKTDKASPNVFTMLVNSENFDIVQDQVGPNGKLTPIFKIHLTGVKGSKRKGLHTNELEEFDLVFQKITWTWVSGGKTSVDNWETNNS